MSQEAKEALAFVGLAFGVALLGLLVAVVGANYASRKRDAAILEMVRAGSSPIEAACALGNIRCEHAR